MTIIITNSENVAFFPRHTHKHTHNWGKGEQAVWKLIRKGGKRLREVRGGI